MNYFLGIDIGTFESKGVITDGDFRRRFAGSAGSAALDLPAGKVMTSPCTSVRQEALVAVLPSSTGWISFACRPVRQLLGLSRDPFRPSFRIAEGGA